MSKMSHPWKHPDSGIYYHRVDVPKDIRAIIGKHSIKFSLHTKSFSEAKKLFLHHYTNTLELFDQARGTSSNSHQLHSEVIHVPSLRLVDTRSPTLKRVVESFIAHKLKMGHWDNKTHADVVMVCDQLLEFVGANVSIDSITREQLREFSVLLSRLPTNYARTAKYKNKSLTKIADMADADGVKTASGSTVKKKFVFVKALFSFAEQEEWVDKDRAKGIVISKGEVQRRMPYSQSDLARLMSATDGASPSLYWLPRIALTTGMRSNEILQLSNSDIRISANK